ncbi:MAG: transporter ATP-binding protein [Ramlibacter sp.]|nr:transporter ATP-binding protein [Ramlibacter sp.]
MRDPGAAGTAQPKLVVRGLEGWYGAAQALHGMDFEVNAGELVTLVGRNGAGKTTTLRALMGLLEKRAGSVSFEGRQTIRMSTRAIARLGLALCPEERAIFGRLTVRENLELPPRIRGGGMTMDETLDLFPRLRERLDNGGTELSGGEQQMLAIARILPTGASLLLLDEPTEGLAPVIVQHIARTVRTLKQRGYTILLVEQNFGFAASVADRHYVVERGRVVDRIAAADVGPNADVLRSYLSV